ncbi:MAG: hypothetical protein KH347_04880, partial [Acetobacter sp.]|nr:hypothetical protein [Acetobacter sp.]
SKTSPPPVHLFFSLPQTLSNSSAPFPKRKIVYISLHAPKSTSFFVFFHNWGKRFIKAADFLTF